MDNQLGNEIKKISICDAADGRRYVKGYIDLLHASPELMTLNEKVMTIALKRFVDIRTDIGGTENGDCYPSRETLARMLGISVRTVSTVTKALSEKKVIQRIRRGEKKNNQYLLTDRSEMWSASSLEELALFATETDEERAIRELKSFGYEVNNGRIVATSDAELLAHRTTFELKEADGTKDYLINRDKKRIYIKVYFDFLDSGLLNSDEMGIFMILKSFLDVRVDLNGQSGCVFPSRETLSAKTGVSVRSVTRIINSLCEKGVIERQRRGFQESNLYILTDRASMWAAVDFDELKKAATETEADRALKLLEDKGYEIYSKNEVLSSSTADDGAAKKTSYDDGRVYSLKYIHSMVNYEWMEKQAWFDDHNKELVDVCIGIIDDVLNSNQKQMKIGQDLKPIAVVKRAFAKLNSEKVLYAIDTFQHTEQKLNQPVGYLRTILYNAGIGASVLADENHSNRSLTETGYTPFSIREDIRKDTVERIRKMKEDI